MARQRIKSSRTKTTRKVRKSKTTLDKNGRVHCKSCGAFLGNRGRKK